MASKNQTSQSELFKNLIEKSELKQLVYQNTFEVFEQLKDVTGQMILDYQSYCQSKKIQQAAPFKVKSKSDFQIELQFAGDMLLFNMHSNIFEFPRKHEVMRTSYVKEENSRSYCGVINIYNFLADSFKYNRINDSGYLIGRIFINKDKHYFIEGKHELGFLFNNFGSYVFDTDKAKSIVEAAISYTINFDLLTPPYSQVQEVSVHEMKSAMDAISLKTGKRLGFKFQADQDKK